MTEKSIEDNLNNENKLLKNKFFASFFIALSIIFYFLHN